MYQPGHEVHQWLSVVTKKWERLADALFDVGTFVKGQKEQSPQVFDKKLLRLWCRWVDAFPYKKFNKFHGIFRTLRRCVHAFKMTGRVSEEGGEVFNGTQKCNKDFVKSMSSHTRRIRKITERFQGNLTLDVSGCLWMSLAVSVCFWLSLGVSGCLPFSR